MIESKLLILPIFIIVNFLIIFAVRSRTSVVIGLTISHLIAALFFSSVIIDYFAFREIILALAVYSMVILFLISNYNASFVSDEEVIKIKQTPLVISVLLAGLLLLVGIFASVFFVTKDVHKISKIVAEKKTQIKNEIVKNPMALPSHAAHIAVKKFYLGRKFENDWANKKSSNRGIDIKKQEKLKDELSHNILFKRSSDIILIIVAMITGLLILSPKNQKT